MDGITKKVTEKVLSEKQRNWISAKWHDKDVDLKKTIRAAGIFTIVMGVLQVNYHEFGIVLFIYRL